MIDDEGSGLMIQLFEFFLVLSSLVFFSVDRWALCGPLSSAPLFCCCSGSFSHGLSAMHGRRKHVALRCEL